MDFVGTPDYVLFRKLQNLKFFINTWSKTVFGNVKKEEVDLTEKIKFLNMAEENAALSFDQIDERAKLLV